ncbi:hypothetical protein BGZ60DRAFT_278017 [Tricladium varicosporioides]|nr:hypothetical protein BGZ60DRAFT_278017 [Hymenoscyphus varicosporioides]
MASSFSNSRSNSRHRPLDESPGSANRYMGFEARAGTKRLFSHRYESKRQSSDYGDRDKDYDENYEDELGVNEAHSEKRHRTTDWPLSSTTPTSAVPARQPLRNRNAPNSPSFRRRSASQGRSSKFVEGSMNDRASQRPPPTYLGIDQFDNRYDFEPGRENRGRKMARPRKFTHHGEESRDRSETSKHSSIFRFGKSIASSFNPSNWKIWSKSQAAMQDEETAHERMLRERQEKAEKLYKELKASGQIRGAAVLHQQEVHREQTTKHDSGVEFGSESTGGTRRSFEYGNENVSEARRSLSVDTHHDSSLRRSFDTPIEQKRMGRVFVEPHHSGGNRRGESPASNYSSSARRSHQPSPNKRSSIDLKRTSLSNIKKVFSSDHTPGRHQARRIPSRKDLHKQQKLVKRVSDLEGKLEAARRQLSDALGEPIPSQPQPKIGRLRFVPGALSTLPSERLLNGYVGSEAGLSDHDISRDIGMAITAGDANESSTLIPGALNAESFQEATVIKNAGTCEWAGRQLLDPPAEVVMQSVERDNASDEADEAIIEPNKVISEMEGVLSEPVLSLVAENDSTWEEEGEESNKETTPKPRSQPKKTTPRKVSTPKKRKGIVEGLADDGAYRPLRADGESDGETVPTKLNLRKKATASRPRKLQRVAQDSSKIHKRKAASPSSPKVTHARKNSLRKSSAGGTPPATKLTKAKVNCNVQQSDSPPPATDFTGLDYMKPSLTNKLAAKKSSKVDTSSSKEVAYIANPEISADVPPMPPMPKAVRLASGEMVNTNAFQSNPTKLTKTNRYIGKEAGENTKLSPEKKLTRAHESFEWPADVF